MNYLSRWHVKIEMLQMQLSGTAQMHGQNRVIASNTYKDAPTLKY